MSVKPKCDHGITTRGFMANRCMSCGTIGIFTDIDDKEYITLRLRSTSRMIPGADHPYPFDGNLTLVWATLYQYGAYDKKRNHLCWLRVAFADATGKTYEKDVGNLTIQEGYRAFDNVSCQISRMVIEPSLNELFNFGFGFG